ncbi:hypothetical protein AAMO2058_000424300 [Amorphochlora amoebiformis]
MCSTFEDFVSALKSKITLWILAIICICASVVMIAFTFSKPFFGPQLGGDCWRITDSDYCTKDLALYYSPWRALIKRQGCPDEVEFSCPFPESNTILRAVSLCLIFIMGVNTIVLSCYKQEATIRKAIGPVMFLLSACMFAAFCVDANRVRIGNTLCNDGFKVTLRTESGNQDFRIAPVGEGITESVTCSPGPFVGLLFGNLGLSFTCFVLFLSAILQGGTQDFVNIWLRLRSCLKTRMGVVTVAAINISLAILGIVISNTFPIGRQQNVDDSSDCGGRIPDCETYEFWIPYQFDVKLKFNGFDRNCSFSCPFPTTNFTFRMVILSLSLFSSLVVLVLGILNMFEITIVKIAGWWQVALAGAAFGAMCIDSDSLRVGTEICFNNFELSGTKFYDWSGAEEDFTCKPEVFGVMVATDLFVCFFLWAHFIGLTTYHDADVFLSKPSDEKKKNKEIRNVVSSSAVVQAQVVSPTPAVGHQKTDSVLPLGWEARSDDVTGDTFYVNTMTGEQSWEPPL